MKTKMIISAFVALIAGPLCAQNAQQMEQMQGMQGMQGVQGMPLPDSLETAAGIEAVTLQMVHEIGAVAVSASPVSREVDRYVVSVGSFTALAGLDGAELLTRTPGVTVADDRISINGAAGAKIFVDGRELRGSTEETVAYLRTLTSGDVARIEVVPQGGAQYSADSRGGVILITLRKRYRDGLEGHLQGATSQGARLSGYSPSGRLGLRTGRWTIDATAGGTLTPRSTGHYIEQRTGGVSGVSDSRKNARAGRGHLAAIFDPDPRHTLALDVEWHGTDTRERSGGQTMLHGVSSKAASTHHPTEGTLTAGLNFIRRLDDYGSQIKVLADYTRHTTGGENLTATSTATSTAYPAATRDSTWRSGTGSRYSIFTAEAGVTRKFATGGTLQAGVRWVDDHTFDRSLYRAPVQGRWHDLPTFSYRRSYRERIGAGWVSADRNFGRWSLSAGLRAEYTDGRGEGVERSYLNLFPTLSATHAFDERRTWMVAAQWSGNIERPSFGAMNPARIQVSEWFWSSGNPELRPTVIDRLSATVIWKGRYTLTVGADLHRDLIREFAGVDPQNPDIMYVRPENHDAENHFYAAASLPLRLTRWWNVSVNSTGVLQRIRIARSGPWASHLLMFNSAISGFTLPGNLHLEAAYQGQSRLHSGNSSIAPRHVVSLTARKKFYDGKLLVGITAANITDAGVGYSARAGGVTLERRDHTGPASRSFRITATWNFRSGSDFNVRAVERASASERKRLSAAEE